MSILITGWDQGLGAALRTRFANDERVLTPEWACAREMTQVSLETLHQFMKREVVSSDVHCLINNFGVNGLSWIGKTPLNDVRNILNSNVEVPYVLIDAFVGAARTPGRVINITSLTHRVPQTCTSLYCASKAALAHMTRTMARELAPKGWVINAVAPGKIEGTHMTSMTDAQVLQLRQWSAKEATDYAIRNIPARRFTTPAEVAEATYLLYQMPEYVNGHILEVTGGA